MFNTHNNTTNTHYITICYQFNNTHSYNIVLYDVLMLLR